MRLSRATLSRVPTGIRTPHGRPNPAIGIVHFGPGAFHRAHQASYIDDLLDHDPRWGIAAVSLRSAGTVRALAAQDGLYTLAVRDADPSLRVIGAHRRFLGPDDHAATAALLADPAVQLVTTTVTEKGYCLAADGKLDLLHPDITHDLAGHPPRSVIGWIVAGLAARRASGTAPFVPMPCDNLANNGAKLHAALVAFASVRDPALADWIVGAVRAPSTMVDSITPASDARLVEDVAAAIGMTDTVPVQRESFSQWVIEDVDVAGITALGSVGATLTGDVAAHERAKLRILNGAHSTLAYLGLLRGHTSVAEAIADTDLAAFIERMIRIDIVPILLSMQEFDIDSYVRAVLARFCNPVIIHRLDQIAQDGSQKLPYRLGDTLVANRSVGKLPEYVVRAIGGWVAYLIRCARDDTVIIDPAAAELIAAVRDGEPRDVVGRLADAGHGIPPGTAGDLDVGIAIVDAVDLALRQDWRRFFA